VIPTPRRLTTDQLEDVFDQLVERALAGDDRALGAIALTMIDRLLAAARAELGELAREDGDVVHDFFAAAGAGRLRFVRGDERASVALVRIVREMARKRRASRGPEEPRHW
jgi:hypothetical protein